MFLKHKEKWSVGVCVNVYGGRLDQKPPFFFTNVRGN